MNASDRLNTCKSRGSTGVAILLVATGARVSNTYGTCLIQGDNPEKSGLIPHSTFISKEVSVKEVIRCQMVMRSIS